MPNGGQLGERRLTWMSELDEHGPYRVESTRDGFQIVDAAGEVILSCGNQANAEHFLALLSQVYRRGYKAGYRQARASKATS